MPRRDRERRPGRREPTRERKPRLLIVSEGVVTERQYFEGLIRLCRNPRVQLVFAREQGEPLTLVRIAKQYRQEALDRARAEADQNLIFESVWCVFDVDEHRKIPDARQMARDNQIELAISNPCFELWLLLHFAEPPGQEDRHAIRRRVGDHVAGYDKAVPFDRFAPGVEAAIRRARRLDRLQESAGTPGGNPSTGVHALAVMIREEEVRDETGPA